MPIVFLTNDNRGRFEFSLTSTNSIREVTSHDFIQTGWLEYEYFKKTTFKINDLN